MFDVRPHDAAARIGHDDLIRQHQGLVRSLAVSIHKSLNAAIELEDLVAYGQVGLAQCAQSYDQTKNAKFSSYAYHRIRGAIYDGLSEMNWLSSEDYKKHKQVLLSGDMLAEQDPDSEAATWTRGTVEKMFVIGMIAEMSDSANLTGDSQHDCPAVAAERGETHQLLRTAVGRLGDREKYLIEQAYFENRTFVEIARSLSLTKSGVSRMHDRALSNLATLLRAIA